MEDFFSFRPGAAAKNVTIGPLVGIEPAALQLTTSLIPARAPIVYIVVFFAAALLVKSETVYNLPLDISIYKNPSTVCFLVLFYSSLK